jgi:hypothetical protein
VKYSRHHELPISSMASLTWHVLVGVLIVVVGYIVTRDRSVDMPIETVAYGDPGGGGVQNGVGNASGLGAPQVEAATEQEMPKDARPLEPLADIKGLQIKAKDLLQGLEDDADAQRELAKFTDHGTQSLQKLAKLDEQFRKRLMGTPGYGQGGPGSGGGKGSGIGQGDGDGEGSGKINARTKRRLRWTLTFNISSGNDYLRQLQTLGAILAFKHPDGEIKVVKELLKRPVKLEVEDIQALNRIFWIDDAPDSVHKLAQALGLDFTPREIVALFPHDMEQTLVEKEKTFYNKREDQILETRFQVRMTGKGYDISVLQQRLIGS